jgi:hypothetical protein
MSATLIRGKGRAYGLRSAWTYGSATKDRSQERTRTGLEKRYPAYNFAGFIVFSSWRSKTNISTLPSEGIAAPTGLGGMIRADGALLLVGNVRRHSLVLRHFVF